MTQTTKIARFDEKEKMETAMCEYIASKADQCISDHGLFSFVLAGGNSPRSLYAHLGRTYKDMIDWSRVHLFWGDERFVDQSHFYSNYAMVKDSLLSYITIPDDNIHPISTLSEKTPKQAAKSYENEITRFFTKNKIDGFDLIQLGIGPDGHTASLFPDDPVLNEKTHYVRAVSPPIIEPKVARMTLTLSMINHCKNIVFYVSGAKKHQVIDLIVEDPNGMKKYYPAAMVHAREQLNWFLLEEERSQVQSYFLD